MKKSKGGNNPAKKLPKTTLAGPDIVPLSISPDITPLSPDTTGPEITPGQSVAAIVPDITPLSIDKLSS